MAFTAADVKILREQTGCGMMDCKKALTDADGNMEKAIEILREKGLAAAAKKATRIAAEGIVVAIVDDVKRVGVVLEVNSETDFVAKNASFVDFANNVARTIIDQNPATVEDLLPMTCAGDTATVEEILRDKILTIGENLKIRRFERIEGDCVAYVHAGGKIGVLVQFDTDPAAKSEFVDFGKDIAMQIAAISPSFLAKEDVSADTLEKEKQILLAQALNEGKPAAIAEKMVNGRISKYYKENCLLEQEFIKDDELTVSKHMAKVAADLGGKIAIVKFVRLEKGEGLAKREDNFADEVASMMK